MIRAHVPLFAGALILWAGAAGAETQAVPAAGAKSAGPRSAPPLSPTHLPDADALFAEAKTLREAGDYAAACGKFAASDRLAPGVGVALYLGDCYDRVGKTASAWLSFRAAEKRALDRKDERAQIAHDRAKAIEPKLGRITFAVARSLYRRGVEVWLDDAGPVSPDTYALGIAADPGDHVVTLKFAGRTVESVHARVSAGPATAAVTLVEPPLPPASVAPPVPNDAPLTSEGAVDPRSGAELGLLILGGVGLAAGAAFLLAKNGSIKNDTADSSPTLDQSASAASAVSFAVAGAAVATAVVLYLTTPNRNDAALAPITLSPLPLVAGGGATLQASF